MKVERAFTNSQVKKLRLKRTLGHRELLKVTFLVEVARDSKGRYVTKTELKEGKYND